MADLGRMTIEEVASKVLADELEGDPARPDHSLRGDPRVSRRREPGAARFASCPDRQFVLSYLPARGIGQAWTRRPRLSS
jgi:hypothetical protein